MKELMYALKFDLWYSSSIGRDMTEEQLDRARETMVYDSMKTAYIAGYVDRKDH